MRAHFGKRRLWFGLLPVGAAAIVATSVLTSSPEASAGTASSFNVACPFSHTAPDDPIVFPGVPGASHMHSFYGNTKTDASSTEASLLAAPSDCVRGFDNTDHSGYWVPTLYKNAGGQQQVEQGHLTVYYQGDGSSGEKITAFPQGLRIIAGDSKATGPQAVNIVNWHCVTSASNLGPSETTIPTCASNQTLTGTIHFPDCWDGKNLDSADHKSHMAYMTGNKCPADHPVRVPKIMMTVAFKGVNGAASQYTLSSGPSYTLHADFFAAWDEPVLTALVNTCLNVGKHCNGETRNSVNVPNTTTTVPHTTTTVGNTTTTVHTSTTVRNTTTTVPHATTTVPVTTPPSKATLTLTAASGGIVSATCTGLPPSTTVTLNASLLDARGQVSLPTGTSGSVSVSFGMPPGMHGVLTVTATDGSTVATATQNV